MEKYIALLSSLPKTLVHRVVNERSYLKIFTDILLGKSMDYLNLYLLFEEGEVYLSDSNNIYMILDDFYDLDKVTMEKRAAECGLTFDDFRIYIRTDEKELEADLRRFQRYIDLLIDTHPDNKKR